MTVAMLAAPPAGLEDLLRGYFAETAESCGRVSREQTRAALRGAWDHGAGRVLALDNGGGGLLLCEPRDWEAAHFGCRVAQLTLLPASRDRRSRRAEAGRLLRAWSDSVDHREQEYAVTRVASDDAPLAMALEEAGFRLLVPMVTLDHALADVLAMARPAGVGIEPVTDGDIDRLGEIARTAFAYGRFGVEPDLPAQVAGDMHAEWARNCGKGAMADATLVAREAGARRPVGFIALRHRVYAGEPTGEINLIAVDARTRGAGIGQALVRAALEWAKQRAVRRMIVRTELPNSASIRMYERCGFRFGEGSLYYRRWRFAPDAPDGATR
jgi:dTDP-4-amino-4,6-dideoxy-D-galactose acyltransferase